MALIILFTGLAFGQTVPNQADFEEIALITGMVSAESDEQLVHAIHTNLSTPLNCEEKTPAEKDPKKIGVTKEKPSVSFYYRMTGPVEDIRLTDIDVDPAKHLQDLEKVIKAQNENDRKAAIDELCNPKSDQGIPNPISNLEKIQYASTLFNLLGTVYNHPLAGGGSDPFSATDPTKNANETQNITIQRQYNALNREYLDGNSDWPPTAGVCRHASSLVSDFLNACGMSANLVPQVGYRTEQAGHAVVKVADPQTGKTYFLNWGEVKAGEDVSGLTNFDIPSDTLVGRGMLIQYYEAGAEGRGIGYGRTNRGVVAARLLHVADDQVDFTTYMTNEAGAVIDLGKKTKVLPSGNWKEVDQQVIVGLIDAKNSTLFTEEKMFGVSGSYKRDATKYFGEHLYWKNRLQTSVGTFTSTDVMDGSGIGFTHRQGMSVGTQFGQKSKTTVELGGDIVGEVYMLKNQMPGKEKTSNFDGSGYVLATLKVKHEDKKNMFEANGSVRTTAVDDMPANDPNKAPGLSVYNPQVSLIYARKLNDDKSIGASTTYVGSFDRKLLKTEAIYTDSKSKFAASGGFTVIRTPVEKTFVYTIVKVEKEFNLKPVVIKAGVGYQQSLTTSTPGMLSTTVLITPKWRRP